MKVERSIYVFIRQLLRKKNSLDELKVSMILSFSPLHYWSLYIIQSKRLFPRISLSSLHDQPRTEDVAIQDLPPFSWVMIRLPQGATGSD